MTQIQSDLLELKNLGAASVNILHAVGINSQADLRQIGAINAYNRIKNRGIQVSKVMLYALEGALTDVAWNELSSELKSGLLASAESARKSIPD